MPKRSCAARHALIAASIVASHREEADLFYKLRLIRKPVDTAKLFDDRYNQDALLALTRTH